MAPADSRRPSTIAAVEAEGVEGAGLGVGRSLKGWDPQETSLSNLVQNQSEEA